MKLFVFIVLPWILCMLISISAHCQKEIITADGASFSDNKIFLEVDMITKSFTYNFEDSTYNIYVKTTEGGHFDEFIVEEGLYKIRNDSLFLLPYLKKCERMGIYRENKEMVYPYDQSFNVLDGELINRIDDSARYDLSSVFAEKKYFFSSKGDSRSFKVGYQTFTEKNRE